LRTRGAALVLAGVFMGLACALITVRYRRVLPEDAEIWGTLALAALAAGLIVLGAGSLLRRET
jgi:hypothetical protein